MEKTLAAFRAARGSPSVSDDAANTITAMLGAVACFSAPPRRRRDSGRRPAPAPKPRPAPERSLEREVMADLNKLSESTLPRLCRKIRLHAPDSALQSIVRLALSRSYNEYETNGAYVSLVSDIVRSRASAVVADVIRGEVPTDDTLRSETILHPADPNEDYDAFCESCKGKRRVIGRGMTLVELLSIRAVSENVGVDSASVYGCHERVMMDIVSGSDVSSPDRVWAIETLLDFIARVAKRNPAVETLARSSLSVIDTSRLSNKCRFKIMDVIGG